MCWSNAALAHIRLDHPAEALDCAQRAVRLSACYARRTTGWPPPSACSAACARLTSPSPWPLACRAAPRPRPPHLAAAEAAAAAAPPPLSAWLPALADGLAHGVGSDAFGCAHGRAAARRRRRRRRARRLACDGDATRRRAAGLPARRRRSSCRCRLTSAPTLRGAWSQLAEAPGARGRRRRRFFATDGAAATAGLSCSWATYCPTARRRANGSRHSRAGIGAARALAALKAHERADDAAAAVAAALEAAGTRVVLALKARSARKFRRAA